MLRIETSDIFRLAVVNSSSNWAYSSAITPFQTNKWYHIAMTYNGSDGSGAHPYINGSLNEDWSNNIAGNIYNSASSLRVGGLSFEYKLNGSIDDVRIYNRVLNQSEISQLASI
jgi:hypothetical protein